MAVIVQNDDGDEAGANAYLEIAAFKSYHDERGNDYSAYTDPQIGAAIVRATDYLDTRFAFNGVKKNAPDQTTEHPRIAARNSSTFLVDSDGEDIEGIHRAVVEATAEYSLRALTAGLFQDTPAPAGGQLIEELSQTVDVISKTVKYASPQSGSFVMPAFPSADLILVRAGLVNDTRQIYR